MHVCSQRHFSSFSQSEFCRIFGIYLCFERIHIYKFCVYLAIVGIVGIVGIGVTYAE